MRLKRLGKSGLQVSELGFGAMTFGGRTGIWGQVGRLDRTEAEALVKTALDAGVTLFDTANVYGFGRSEEILGEVLTSLGVPRHEVVIATKVGSNMGPGRGGASRGHILDEAEASLARLGVDHIDLYQIHAFDPATPIEETLGALNDLVRSGKVRYIGLSNWAAWTVMKAIGLARDLAPITALQAYYNLAGRDIEREIAPMLAAEGVGLMVWSPLAGGYLTGKYQRGEPGRQDALDFPPLDRGRGAPLLLVLGQVAARHGATMAQVAIAWTLAQAAVSTVLLGARTSAQLTETLASARLQLAPEDLAQLDAVSRLPREYPGWLLEG